MKTARQSLAAGHAKVQVEPGTLLRRGWQRSRVIRQRAQIVDHVGALAVLWQAGKSHRGAGDVTLGVSEEFVQLIVGPGAAFGLHGSREIEPASLASWLVDDPVKIGADPVGAALFEGMAGRALLGPRRALFVRCGLQQVFDPPRRRRWLLSAALHTLPGYSVPLRGGPRWSPERRAPPLGASPPPGGQAPLGRETAL